MSDAQIIKQADAQLIFDAGMRAGKAFQTNGPDYVLVPQGSRLSSLEGFQERPSRKHTDRTFVTPAGFIAYVNRFKMDGLTMMFSDIGEKSAHVIFDYHENLSPFSDGLNWMDHIARFRTETTEDWCRWTDANKRKFSQMEFVHFLEVNMGNIMEPESATVYEVCRSLEAHKKVQFKSHVRMDNGDHSVLWEEKSQERSNGGNIAFPSKLALGIKPFRGSDPYRIECHLRYRISEGSLFFIYELERPNDVLDAAFNDFVELIEKETGLKSMA